MEIAEEIGIKQLNSELNKRSKYYKQNFIG